MTYEVNVSWLIKNRIILVEPVGDFESSIAINAIEQVKRLLDQEYHHVHIIMHMSHVRTPVKDPQGLGCAFKDLRFHRNMGCVIFITTNPITRIGGHLLARFLGTPFKVVNSYDQALKILRSVDPTLDLFHVDMMNASTGKWITMNSIRIIDGSTVSSIDTKLDGLI